MKKLYFIFSTAMVAVAANAQTAVTDSIQTGGSYANEVWYSFANGKVSEAPIAQWQLAFDGSSVIRTNSASQSNAVTLYVSPASAASDTSAWLTFDTAGYASWVQPANSDSVWSIGAFNQDASGVGNYGWGVYAGGPTHNVNGVKAYLIKYGTSLKRLFVKVKGSGFGGGSANWEVRVANIDGSDVKYINFPGNSNKNFVYVDLDNGTSLDREPAKADWDFVLTRYAAWQPAQSVYYPSIGILTNAGVTASEVRNKPADATTLADTVPFSNNISTIGADWKQLNNATFAFYAVDSLSYFVKLKNGDIWKLVFKSFASGSSPSGTGRAVFVKTKVYPSSGGGTTDTLNVNQTTLSYAIGGESKNVTVSSSQAWTATASDSWITLTPASGAAGSGSVSITAAANTGAARTGSVTFTAGTLTATVAVSQAGTTPPPPAGMDSIQTGGSYANDVFYSFENGTVKETVNSDWQLAFGVGTFNVAVRSNTTTGSTGNGSVVIYEIPGTDTSKWTAFDTTGAVMVNNSDENWEAGALNQNSSGFDYGWGTYDQNSHIVTGHRLYLAEVQSGGSTLYKKIWVVNKTLGTWLVRFANLDGSDAKELTLPSSTYNTKNFVYVSLVTGNVVDREPAKTDWDFVLTRYAAWQPVQSVYYPSIGILTNAGVTTSEVRNKPADATTLADTVPFSDNISTIGADWKQLNGATFAFYAVDSLSYFVKVKNGDIWKLVFKSFASGSSPSGTGRAVFVKTKVFSTGLASVDKNISTFTVYPNPTSDVVNVIFDVKEENSSIAVMDISGRTLHSKNVRGKGFQNEALDLSSFAKGVYFISITNGGSRSVQKVIVQ